jgi:hypothetical protein
LCGGSVDILGDRFLIEIRGDRCFGVVGLLSGDRLCGRSMDVLGDRFLIEIRDDRSLMLLVRGIACVVEVRIFEAIAF